MPRRIDENAMVEANQLEAVLLPQLSLRTTAALLLALLLRSLGLYRPRLGFYALRHTFETIGGEAKDQVAVDHIMGHVRDDMASVYRERISDERLRAVTDHVRAWLWPPAKKATRKKRSG